MKHKIFGRGLGRDIKEKKALFRSLIKSLIIHGKIQTSVAKAKAVRGLIEKTITRAKKNTNAGRRAVQALIVSKPEIKKLYEEIIPAMAEKNSGYISIRRTVNAKGDNTEKAFIEWSVKITAKADKKNEKKKPAGKIIKKTLKKEVKDNK